MRVFSSSRAVLILPAVLLIGACTGPIDLAQTLGETPWPITSVDYHVEEVTLLSGFGGNPGGPFSGSFSVTNSGELDHAGSPGWMVYVSTDGTMGSGDLIVASGTIPGLKSGETLDDVGFTGFWPDVGGDFHLMVVVSSPEDPAGADKAGLSAKIVPANNPVAPPVDLLPNYDIETIEMPFSGVVGQPSGNEWVFLVVETNGVDGKEPLSYDVHWSTTPEIGPQAILTDFGTVDPRPAASKGEKVMFDGTWPPAADDYYLLVRIFAADDADPADNVMVWGPLTVTD